MPVGRASATFPTGPPRISCSRATARPTPVGITYPTPAYTTFTNTSTSSVIRYVGASADVAVSRSSPASVTAGNNFDYTITVTNLGPSIAASITVTDDLPANVIFVSASAGGFFNGTQVLWTNFAD